MASVGVGAWDLWKAKAGDVLRVVGLAELSLVAGAALESFVPGGLAAGAVAAWVVGARGVTRIGAAREKELQTVLLEAPDATSRMLVLYDRVDVRRVERTGPEQVAIAVSLGLLGLMAVGLVVMGLTYDVWQAVLAGIGLSFLPVSQFVKSVTASGERRQVEARLAAPDGAGELLESGGGETG